MSKRRFTLTTVFAVLVIGLMFSFPSVRAAANEFLGLFRVQKFAPISVSPRQLRTLERLAEQGLYPGELEVIQDPGPAQSVDSVAQAGELAGMKLRTPSVLRAPARIEVQPGGSGKLTVNLANARAILESADLDPQLLPDNLDGADIAVRLYPAVAMTWIDDVTLLQTASPEVNYPTNVDPAIIGQALLELLGMSSAEASRLAQSIDWSSTLVMPVPQEIATFNEVRIDGVSGLAVTEISGQGSFLLWQKNGILYMLAGPVEASQLLPIADSLR